MKETAGLRLALCLAAAVASAAMGSMAADDKGPEKATPTTTFEPAESPAKGNKRDTYPFRGVIASIDTTNRTVTLEGRQTRRVLRVTEVTRFEKEGKPLPFAELKKGEAVGGTLKRIAPGLEEAVLIRVGMKKPPGVITESPDRERNGKDEE
jgi:hypothetical protein